MGVHTVTHSCGHDYTYKLNGNASARESRCNWLATIACPDCRREARQESAVAALCPDGLPVIGGGTEKQIAWAEKIREKQIAEIYSGFSLESLRFVGAAKSAIEERCEGKRERAFDLTKLRRYKNFDDTFANFLGGREILIIEKIAYGAPDTDSWDTVRDAVDASKRAAANALKNPPPNRGPKATATNEETEKNGTAGVIIAMMRDDPEFAQEVEALAFRHFKKKLEILKK